MTKKAIKLTPEELNNFIAECANNATVNSQTTKADSLSPKDLQSVIAPYKGCKFMFFTFRETGNVVHFVFEIENIKNTNLFDGKATLEGTATFGDTQLDGSIVVDLINDKACYKHKQNRHKYVLTPDNRTIYKWNALLNTLKDSFS